MSRETESAPEQQLARFSLAEGTYAIDIMKVREVLSPLTVTRVPGSPEFLEGIAELRGDYLPVIDLRRRLGLPAGPDYKIVIAMARGRRIGLVVDQVFDVFRVEAGSIQPLDELAQSAAFAGVLRTGAGAVLILDPDGVLTEVEDGALDNFLSSSA